MTIRWTSSAYLFSLIQPVIELESFSRVILLRVLLWTRHWAAIAVRGYAPAHVRARRAPAALFALAGVTIAAAPACAQEPERDSIPTDVRVGILYQPAFRPGVAVPTFESSDELVELADSARAIMRRDLSYSDRLDAMSAGEEIASQGPLNHELWDELGAVWLLIGAVEGDADAPVLRLSLHDIVFRLLQEVREFDLPRLGHAAFRQAVHGATDEVVAWATGSRGIAASRIAYVASSVMGSEIYAVDSDGFGAVRLTSDSSIALSPAWSPSGDRIAYMTYTNGDPAIYELTIDEGSSSPWIDLPGLDMTPSYSPDGGRLAFAATVEGRTEIYLYDLDKRCCPDRTTFARFANSLSPTFSPDGRRIAFNSDRLGQLHIFVMDLEDGTPELVTPYIYDRSIHNAAPDWSPRGDRIAFHGRVDGAPQIFTVAPDGTGLRQLTQTARNEDPSWGPDGRHIVFASTRDGADGLWIVDAVSGRIRRLVRGNRVRLPDWSGRLDSHVRISDGAAASFNRQNP